MILYILLILFVCCTLFLTSVVLRYRKQMSELYDTLLQRLDYAISGKSQVITYDESFDSAITERLNRIVQMTKLQKAGAEKERDIVKSLISDISHQIKTPLSNILLYTGLLKECNLYDSTLALADKIESNSQKLDFFMKELLKSSYTEREIIAVQPQKTSVAQLIDKSCQLVELAAMKKNICLCKEYTEAFCYADEKWTIEAIANTIENAVKYSTENTKIYITVVPYDSFLCIQVKDNGIGINESEQGKVFQRFYRGTNARNYSGFGIGLYLAREVLSKQGGYIKLNSKINKGTTVHIFLLRDPM